MKTAPLPSPPEVDAEKAGAFRFRALGPRYLLTNDVGEHQLLEAPDFHRFIAGKLKASEPLHRKLRAKGFVRDHTDFPKLISAWRERHRYLWQGPCLHIVVVTLRCDHRCVYCQTSSVAMDRPGFDMSEQTARKVVDVIFQSPSPALTLEFQGGEPLANWPAVRFIVEYALEKKKETGKELWLHLVTNLSLMDDEKLDFLLDRGVHLCTSLDGPAEIHDANRVHLGGGSHASVVKWWRKIRRRTAGRAYRIDALMTTTRLSLGKHREIVDAYLELGAAGIYLRPMSPYGIAQRTWQKVGYEPEEFLAFYRDALDHILELNLKGRRFFEQTARIFAMKILKLEEPNFLDLRSPCGAGIGQLAYNYDGSVFTCDEGRMLSRMADETFRLGHAGSDDYGRLAKHPTLRALATASLLDNQAECSTCAYMPYCGVCPIQNYVEQGDIFPRTPTSVRCRIHKGILDHLFERLRDPKIAKVLKGWTASRPPQTLYRR